MEADGTIFRQRNAEDARLSIVRLTDKGIALVNSLAETRAAHDKWLEKQLGKSELKQLHALLEKVINLKTDQGF